MCINIHIYIYIVLQKHCAKLTHLSLFFLIASVICRSSILILFCSGGSLILMHHAPGASQVGYGNRVARDGAITYFVYFLFSCMFSAISLDVTYRTSDQRQIIENFHTVRGEHLSVPWSLGFGVMASPETHPAVNTISS